MTGQSNWMASVMEQFWPPQLLLKERGKASWAMVRLTRQAVARVGWDIDVSLVLLYGEWRACWAGKQWPGL